RGGACFIDAILRDVDRQPLRDDRAALRVFEAIEKHADDAEARRHDAAGVAGMNAFIENFDSEVADDRAAKRRRHPKLIVVAATAVEADDESRRADAIGEKLDVCSQIE